jgi:hypothetical protein
MEPFARAGVALIVLVLFTFRSSIARLLTEESCHGDC